MHKFMAIDVETYFDTSKGYTLKKLSIPEYVRNELFRKFSLATVIGSLPGDINVYRVGEYPFNSSNESFVIRPDEEDEWWAPSFVKVQELNDFTIQESIKAENYIAHNAAFDMYACGGWIDGNANLICTMQLARFVLGRKVGSYSLDALNKFYGKSDAKQKHILVQMDGVEDLRDVDEAIAHKFLLYNAADAQQCWDLFATFRKEVPDFILTLCDMITRMAVEPAFRVDTPMLEKLIVDRKEQQRAAMAAVGCNDIGELRSSERFATMLKDLGVVPPVKTSNAPTRRGQQTYAFARKDPEFNALTRHPDWRVRALVEARLQATSNLEGTRAERLYRMAIADPWNFHLPVYLRLSGARTHRFSGDGGINMQNLPRDSELRDCLTAPPGEKIVSADAAQIEARILAWLAGETFLLNAFARGEDVYSQFARTVYRKPVSKTENPELRFIGKTCILGLGYNAGAQTFHNTLVLDRPDLSYQEAERLVKAYRNLYPAIPALWRQAHYKWLPAMVNGEEKTVADVVNLMKDGWYVAPGIPVRYNELQRRGNEYVYYDVTYTGRKEEKKLYGGKLVENVVQHLAWLQIAGTMVEMRKVNPEWHCALQVHDELVYVVDKREAEQCLSTLIRYLSTPQRWTKKRPYPLPLAAEGGIGDTYFQTKGGG